MKQITLSFTHDELRELAKQLYLGSYFLTTCDYDNQTMVDDIMTRICGTGFVEAPETNGFRQGGFQETLFTISEEVDDECDLVVKLYEDYCVAEYLPYVLADRDFEEQHGTLDSKEILNTPTLLSDLQAIQNKYKQEFETYGITHLRLKEEE